MPAGKGLSKNARTGLIVAVGGLGLYVAYRYYQSQSGGTGTSTSGSSTLGDAMAAQLGGQEQTDVSGLQTQEQTDVSALQTALATLTGQETSDVASLTAANSGLAGELAAAQAALSAQIATAVRGPTGATGATGKAGPAGKNASVATGTTAKGKATMQGGLVVHSLADVQNLLKAGYVAQGHSSRYTGTGTYVNKKTGKRVIVK